MAKKAEIDIKKLRYVLYVRKSTEDESRQVKSKGDQIKECLDLAEELGINVVAILDESKSAKIPNQRPVFKQMIDDIEAGKYDGILCWHPDRLSRNMLEGGYVINMLDTGVLKDMRFKSHQFSNDANGKMLLGMLFVFSKQYSDDLSDKVSRGVNSNFDQGKSAGTPKWGYDRSEINGLYNRNVHFEFVREAWYKRAAGTSVKEILEYLEENNVSRTTKDPRRRRDIHFNYSTLAKMFKDPFAYGLLIQAGQEVYLPDIMPEFEPLVTKEIYQQVQTIGRGKVTHEAEKKRATFYPLRGVVYCSICHSSKYMGPGKNKNGSGVSVLSYRCNNKECNRSPKSLRAKNIFNSIYEILDHIQISDELYDRYDKKIDTLTDRKIIEIKQKMHSNQAILSSMRHDIEERALALGKMKPGKASDVILAKLEGLSDAAEELEEKISKQSRLIQKPTRIKMSKDELLNLLKTAADKMRAGTAVEKDALFRILFLNVHVDNEKVTDYLWNEPFNDLLNSRVVSSGGAGRS